MSVLFSHLRYLEDNLSIASCTWGMSTLDTPMTHNTQTKLLRIFFMLLIICKYLIIGLCYCVEWVHWLIYTLCYKICKKKFYSVSYWYYRWECVLIHVCGRGRHALEKETWLHSSSGDSSVSISRRCMLTQTLDSTKNKVYKSKNNYKEIYRSYIWTYRTV